MLWSSMPALRARERLERDGADMKPEEVYRAFLEATGGDRDAAERAYSRRVIELARIKSGS